MNREEAIEVYHGLINTKIKEAFEFFAPELREINEEEIRKDLIGGLMWQRDNLKSEGPHDNNLILPGFCLTVGKHIAYLEKQKEPTKEELYAEAGTTEKEYIANTMKMVRAMREKQKEQKPELVQQPPITYTYNSNASRDERLKAALLALLNSDLLKVKEGGYFTKQDLIEWVERIPTDKPTENDCQFIDEWFMETDFWKQYVKDSIIPGSEPTQQDIDFLLPQAKNLFALATKDMCNGCKDWSRGYNAGLANAEKEKSVIVIKQEYDSHSIVTRDAVSVKPAEWSEEDEMMRQGCIDSVKYELLDNGMDDEVETDPRIAWLKSLRPSWKPSEEQMRALNKVVNGEVLLTTQHESLESLYEQLKKL